MNLLSNLPCPCCNGSGRAIDLRALRRAVESSGKPLRTISRETGISSGYLANLLSGARPLKPNQLQAILSAIGVRLHIASTDPD